MALRVLLCDESSTIKKVMLLALQDFAVEVKAVHVGVDALEVARSYKPDIIFVDVLLQKKNGYEVCAELKADATTRHTPTVLMWSSFMELDQEQLERAKPSDKIEKPFDVETLRKLVLNLVPETRSQRLAHFLEFPESANEALKQDTTQRKPGQASPAPPPQVAIPMPPPAPNSKTGIPLPPPTTTGTKIPVPPPVTRTSIPMPPPTAEAKPETQKPSWSMDSFEDINQFAANDFSSEAAEEFAPMNLTRSTPVPQPEERELTIDPASEPAQDEPWAAQDLSRFKIDLPPVSVENEGLDLKIDMGEEEFTASGFLYRPDSPRQAERSPEPQERTMAMPPPTSRGELQLEDFPEEDLTQPVLEMPDENSPMGLALDERDEAPEPLSPMRESSYGRRDENTIPQLSADRIEEIIRAQSREIIEEVVRRVVPDIATEMIREELDRLLEETSVRQSRRREPRP